uniref:ribonuclease H n=1 Tax=Salarias fasciatus TaxID=181472 RepID=A0A672GZN6_SALFA
MFASLSGGQRFSKLDLSQAYLQVPVNEESKKYLTITTHKGMFCYSRLPFGITSAPSVFQKIMDQVLQGLPNVHCFLDDILVTGKDDAHHLENLDAVLHRLEQFGLRVKREKCEFFQQSLEYLGHVIDEKGLHKSPDKIRAILDAPEPTNTTQLRSFLGLVNYYARFVPNLSAVLHPLNVLLRKEAKWEWSKECKESFQTAKEQLASERVLIHYDPALPVILACDASPYGVGAVISHKLPSGEEKPIAFASRTLSKAEQNYAQIEREALGIIFGVRRFHSYLYGRHFTLLTDHRPLTTILSPSKAIPSMAAARLQRWALLLAAHDYTIQYRRAVDHGNTDGLSRLPIPEQHKDKLGTIDMLLIKHLDCLPIRCADVR